MKHKHLRLMALLALLAALLLAACGGGGEEPAAPEETTTETTAEESESAAEEEEMEEAEPTAEPEPTDEPEPIDEPAPEMVMGEAVTTDEGGFTVQAPADFTVDVFGDSITMVAADADPDLGPQFFLSGGPLDEGETVDTILADFQSSVLESIADTVEEPVDITIGDLAGYSLDFTAVENDQDLKGRIVIVGDDTRAFVIFGGAAATRWDEETAAQFESVLDGATFFEPVVAEAEVAEDDKGKSDEGSGAVGVTVGSSDPGIACFGSLVDGITCLTADGTWLPLTTDNSDLGGDIVNSMVACGNSIYMAHNNGITIFDGENFTNFEGGWGFSSPSGMACTADGSLWVTHFQGVSYYDGAGWTTYESSLLSSGDSFSDLVEGVVVAADGTVWVTSANAIASFDGAEWTIYQQGEGLNDQYFFDNIVLDGSGQPWAVYSGGVLQWTGSEWVEHESDFFSLEGGAVDGEGNLWVGTFSDGATVYDGSSWTNFTVDDGLSNNTVRDIAVDGSGRVWLATRWGLSVWTGFDWQVYRMDTADLIDHDLYTAAVVGAGPALPEELSKAPGILTGLITLDEAPFADTTVEICIQTLGYSYYGDTPCSDQQLFYSTTTDESGIFTFEDVPVGLYVITVNTGDDSWAQLETDYGTGERVFIGEGETTDVGELYIVSEE